MTLHPIGDGNSRMARAVGDLFLARADGSPQRFSSLSVQVHHPVERAAGEAAQSFARPLRLQAQHEQVGGDCEMLAGHGAA